ncbi:MAG: hypothetical protein ACR2K1_03940 [Saprospiraceae bacterium]
MNNTSILAADTQPWKQALVIASGAFAIMLLGFLLTVSGLYAPDSLFAWSIASAFLLLFALFNSLLSLNSKKPAQYWGQSVYSYIGLAVVMSLAAWLFSGISLDNAGYYKFIYLVVTIGFMVFSSMVNFMKKIVQFAEREEWSQPRKRRR